VGGPPQRAAGHAGGPDLCALAVFGVAGSPVCPESWAVKRAAAQEIDTVLATMLRQAATNVLRHARARLCEIELTVRRRVPPASM
jgi:hypothetical protein